MYCIDPPVRKMKQEISLKDSEAAVPDSRHWEAPAGQNLRQHHQSASKPGQSDLTDCTDWEILSLGFSITVLFL